MSLKKKKKSLKVLSHLDDLKMTIFWAERTRIMESRDLTNDIC
jgi:hypothetical protein